MTENINTELQKAVLIGIIKPDINEAELQTSLDELERLCETAGVFAEARLLQSRSKPDPATYIGAGKLEEVKSVIEVNGINLAVIDDELSPSQIRNIEDKLDIEVIDRTMLILEIFANHAHTSEGKLQVEIAQLRYTAPRLTGKGKEMTRLGGGGVGGGGGGGGVGGGSGGGGGVGGARRGGGESRLEIERRIIRANISTLEKEIAQLEKTRGLMRSRREKIGIPSISIAGYTNSGKSTLLNYLTNAGVLAENKLFATLDPTTRRLKLPNSTEILLTDTVGLIKKLPHHLVRAFKSTLDEIVYADIILLVADISDPEHQTQIEVTRDLLAEMGASDKPFIIVYNKIDAVEKAALFDKSDVKEVEAEAFISAKTGEGVENLLLKIQEVLESQRRPVTFMFELNGKEQSYINDLYKNSFVSDVEYNEKNVIVKAVADKKTRNIYAEFLR
jgi:GTP-binding protein HflX